MLVSTLPGPLAICLLICARIRVLGLTTAPNLFGLVAIENYYMMSYRHHIIKVSLDFYYDLCFRDILIGNLTTPKLQISFLGSATTIVSYHVASHPFYVLGVATLSRCLISYFMILNHYHFYLYKSFPWNN